jgi:hypothetical protein
MVMVLPVALLTARMRLLVVSATKMVPLAESKANWFGFLKRARLEGPSAKPKAVDPVRVATAPEAGDTARMRWPSVTYRVFQGAHETPVSPSEKAAAPAAPSATPFVPEPESHPATPAGDTQRSRQFPLSAT